MQPRAYLRLLYELVERWRPSLSADMWNHSLLARFLFLCLGQLDPTEPQHQHSCSGG